MHKTSAIQINSKPNQHIRMFVNNELFLDQAMPFAQNKVTLNYISTLPVDTVDVEYNSIHTNLEITTDKLYTIDCNK